MNSRPKGVWDAPLRRRPSLQSLLGIAGELAVLSQARAQRLPLQLRRGAVEHEDRAHLPAVVESSARSRTPSTTSTDPKRAETLAGGSAHVARLQPLRTFHDPGISLEFNPH